jgi:hypothetical protein
MVKVADGPPESRKSQGKISLQVLEGASFTLIADLKSQKLGTVNF